MNWSVCRTALFLGLLTASADIAFPQQLVEGWAPVAFDRLDRMADDDVDRHADNADYLKGIVVSQQYFSEAGFNWHIIRFVNLEKPVGPLWAVPHDDENAAFEAAIEAVKRHGGVVVTVNSWPVGSRLQDGDGTCGGRPKIVAQCDPNRNFSAATPRYTGAFLGELSPGQPIIALHTNSPGHGREHGNITILDRSAAAKGNLGPRADGHFGAKGSEILQNHDTYAIIPYLPPRSGPEAVACREALVVEGVHVWHERVWKSDGSLSNYIAIERPSIAYINMESRRESDLALAASRHGLMIEAYLKHCSSLGD